MTPASIGTPLKNRFYIQYIVAQNIQVYFILCCFAQNKDFFSGVLQVVSSNKYFSVGVQSPTEINAPRGRTLSGRQWFCADRNGV